MIDIRPPLSRDESASLYSALARLGARTILTSQDKHFTHGADEEILALAAEQSRFDFRLLYVLVALFAEHLERFHPFRLRTALLQMKSPAVWGVIAEFARKVNSSPDLEDFFSILLREVPPVPDQVFFIRGLGFDLERQQQEVLHAPDEFRRWGFFCTEAPLLKELKLHVPARTFERKTRLRILHELLGRKKRVKVGDYLTALEHAISRQQAHKDLSRYPRIRAISDRRGRWYELRP